MWLINLCLIVLFFSLSAIITAYALYPFIVLILGKIKKRITMPQYSDDFKPKISMIIPARNEEQNIELKIRNTLQLDYTPGQLEIIVVSDQSTDGTEAIAEKFNGNGVRLIRHSSRQGKTLCQNLAVEQARGDILVFSDANAMYHPQALLCLVRHFQNPDVGCVSGELNYIDTDKSPASREENIYWRYEKFIKKQENKTFSILGANGSIYAVRKTDYIPLESFCVSDFIEPLEIAAKGKIVFLEPEAISEEKPYLQFQSEFIRRRRIVSRSLFSLLAHSHLLNPLKHPSLALGLFMHKIMRWITAFFMLTAFAASAILAGHGVIPIFFWMQVGFISLAIVGYLLKNQQLPFPALFAPYYICLLTGASILGVWDCFSGKIAASWEPIRSADETIKKR
jgi:cellulose synthase/poly-beta-1,6-N-acetylglucosamine synthase-like glycosyltransferase